MLQIPQIAQTRQLSPYLYEALQKIVAAVNSLGKRVGVDPVPAAQNVTGVNLPAPAAPATIAVAVGRGIFNITLGASAGSTTAAQYFVELGADPLFAATVVYPLGTSLAASISLGNVVRYLRARAKYPESGFSPYVIFGGAAPVAVAGGLAQTSDLQVNLPLNYTNNATVDSIDAGSSATLRIYGMGGVGSSWTRYTGQGTQTLPAGTITGLAYSTTFYVVWTGTAYQASTSLTNSVNDSYIFAGKPTTVAAGGSGGSSGGGGGTAGNGGRNVL